MKHIYGILIVMLFTAAFATAQRNNYVVNGDFENNYANWVLLTGENLADFQVDTENPIAGENSARIDIIGTGANTFDARLESRFTVHKDQEIKVSFKIKASEETFFNLEVAQNYPDFFALYRSEANEVINTDVQTMEYIMTPTFSDPNFKLAFMVGNLPEGVSVWIDDVVVEETDGEWDGNIIANGQFDEFETPTEEDAFPPYRLKKLATTNNTPGNGGWEGGFMEGGETDIAFDIDESGKLSGANAAYIQVNNKANENFFNGLYSVFFQAEAGQVYEFSFDVAASQNVNFAVAMNRFPFDIPGEYELQPDRFFLPIEATTETQRLTIVSDTLTDSQMYHIFFAGLPPGGPYEVWLDNVSLVLQEEFDEEDEEDDDEEVLAVNVPVEKFNVYPNPSIDGSFRINTSELNMKNGYQVKIFSLEGKELFVQEITNQNEFLFRPNLTQGLYLLKLENSEKIYTSRLLVK